MNTNYFKNIIMGSVFRKALLELSFNRMVQTSGGGQYLSGYDSAFKVNGMEFYVNPDGTIILNGTANDEISITMLTSERVHLEAGTYTLSGCPEGGGKNTYHLAMAGVHDFGEGATFTTTETRQYSVHLYIHAGVTSDAASESDMIIFKPQLVTGSAALPRNYYLGISSTVPTVEGENVTEPSTVNSGYGRVLLSSSLSTPSNGVIVNTDSISFPESKTDWFSASSPAIYYVIYDSYTGGNLLMYNQLTAPRIIEENTIVTIKANSIYLRLLD